MSELVKEYEKDVRRVDNLKIICEEVRRGIVHIVCDYDDKRWYAQRINGIIYLVGCGAGE